LSWKNAICTKFWTGAVVRYYGNWKWRCSYIICHKPIKFGHFVGNKLYFTIILTFIPNEDKSKSYKHSLIIYWTALVHILVDTSEYISINMLITFLFQNIALWYFQHLCIAYVYKHLKMSVKCDMNNTLKQKIKNSIFPIKIHFTLEMSQRMLLSKISYCLTKKQLILKIFIKKRYKVRYWEKKKEKSAFRQVWLTKKCAFKSDLYHVKLYMLFVLWLFSKTVQCFF